MKKQKLSPILAAGVAAAVQFNPGQVLASPVPINTITFTNETDYNNLTEVTIPISPAIANADKLVSISEGAATGYESGIFTFSVDYTGNTPAPQQIDSVNSGSLNVNFNTIVNKAFTEGDIDGLTFAVTGNNHLNIPIGTIFTFEVVPEPATFALAGMGAAGMWFAARRRASQTARE